MEILNKILPDKEEIKNVEKNVESFLSKFSFKNIKFTIGGSYAKGTWLSGNKDIDIFVKFKYEKYLNKNISLELEKILKKKRIKFEIVHGSRDYFHIIRNGTLFELVPVLDISRSNKLENIMDVSPLHVNYIKKKLNNKMKNDVRLLKQFCKANNLYGAESYIKGFSGYALEILICYYKSLTKLMKEASKWKERKVIDLAKHYKSSLMILRSINKSKISSLVLIDPVQLDRNAASALSKENYKKFISLAKLYDGSESFFMKKEINLKNLKGYSIFRIVPLEGKKSIVGAKLVKSLDKIKKSLEKEGFEIYDYGWKWEENAYFWFKTSKLDKFRKHYGPLKSYKEHLKKFKEKWKGKKFYYSKGKAYVKLKRENVDSSDVIRDILKRKDVKVGFKKFRKV
jgi:tRNA nucleotidyltransferase (CCA-adding enzyme)